MLVQAQRDGVHIDVVNIMAMDYYDGNTAAAAAFIKPNGTYNMLKAAEVAANKVEAQLVHLHMTDTLVGITPMIGQNDDYGQAGYDGVQEFFSLKDAKGLEHWAESRSWVAGLGEWALPRDRAGTAETHPTSPNDLGPEHSGAAQTDWQYATILNQVTRAPVSGATLADTRALSAAFESSAGAGHAWSVGHDAHFASGAMIDHTNLHVMLV